MGYSYGYSKRRILMETQELLRAAQLLFVEEKDAESIEAYTKAIEAGAAPYIAHLSRGVAYVKTKDVENAIGDFDKAVNANPQSFRAYFYRGIAHMMKEEFEKAIEDFTFALKLKTDYGMAMFSRAVSLARLGRYEEAAQDMQVVAPQMEQSLQSFADTYGIVRTEMWKVMAQVSGEAETPTLALSEKEMDTIKKWLEQE
jgi:tetratricopeptide (TPR) repeat protein